MEIADEALGKLGAIMERCEQETLHQHLWCHGMGLYNWHIERIDPDGGIHGVVTRRDRGGERRGVFIIDPEGKIETNVEAFQIFDELI